MGPGGTIGRWVLEHPAPITVLFAPTGCGGSETLAAISQLAGVDVIAPGPDRRFGDRLRSTFGDPLVLIDSFDRLDETEQADAGSFIESTVGQNSRVVVATRTRPLLPLRRWQVEGLAEVVGADRLLLDREAQGAVLGLSGAELDRAVEVTQGWHSAVSLLDRHLQSQPLDVALTLTHFDHLGFITEEVLEVLAPAERELLRGISVIDRLDPAVVEAVSGTADAPGRLRSITERTQLFESTPHGVVWRGDVRASLRNDLECSDAASIPGRHLAAARAMANDRRLSSVRLHHLVDAGAWEDAIALVLDRWKDLLQPDRFDDLVRAVVAMPAGLVRHDAGYSLGVGAILLMWGQPVIASEFLDAECVRAEPGAAATASALQAHATWWTTAPEHALDLVEQTAEILDSDSRVSMVPVIGFESITAASMLLVSSARALALTGELRRAAELLQDLGELPLDDPVTTSVSAWATKALVDSLAGDLIGASGAADVAFSLAIEGGWIGTPSLAPAHLARAVVMRWSGSRDDPWPSISDAAEISTRAGAWNLLRVCRAVAALCGDVDRPLSAVEANEVARVPIADRIIGSWRAHHLLDTGHIAEARALLTVTAPVELGLGPWAEVSLELRGGAATSETIDTLAGATTESGRVDRLLAAAVLTPDDPDVLARLATAATTSGLVGMLRSAGAEVRRALSQADPTLAGILDDRGDITAPPELSAREVEILHLLDGPMSVSEIGRQLYLSGHTVKWYTSRIYRKLDVHERADAVRRANELGVIRLDDRARGHPERGPEMT